MCLRWIAMAQDATRVRIDAFDWVAAMPVLNLLKTFRTAIAPTRMAPAVLLVVLMFLIGHGLDLIWGARVAPGEFEQYLAMASDDFDQWHAKRSAGPITDDHRGVFAAALRAEVAAFQGFIASAVRLDFGLETFINDRPHLGGGVAGALWVMVLGVPGWLLSTYPGFTAVFCLLAFVVLCGLGGLITRLAAVQACTGEPARLGAAAGFVARRYVWFFLTPVIPLAVALLLGLVLMLAGLVFFNLPVLDVAGALLMGPMLLVGLAIATLFVGLLLGGNLLLSAVAVEGTDAFDAISRAFNYALGRPLRFLVYQLVVIVYGAVTYVLVGVMVFLTLWLTQRFLSVWAFAEVGSGVPTAGETTRLEAILPEPVPGKLYTPPHWSKLGESAWGTAAAGIASAWVQLLLAILPAYALCYYLTAQTWVYLLLRRATDGTEFEEHDQQPPDLPAAPNKIEAPAEPS